MDVFADQIEEQEHLILSPKAKTHKISNNQTDSEQSTNIEEVLLCQVSTGAAIDIEIDIEADIELEDIKNLKPHEEIDSQKLHEVRKSIEKDGLKHPIVADRKTGTILDGHHRYNAFIHLKIEKIPVFFVDYMHNDIILASWKEDHNLTKEDVIRMAESDKVFPKKTTRHLIRTKDGTKHISKILPTINDKKNTNPHKPE